MEHDKRKITRWQIDRAVEARLEGAEACFNCRIKDISFKGVRIVLAQKLPPDTFLRLTVNLSDDFSFQAEVWVVWHKKIAEANVYGLYFSRIADSDKEKIYKFVLKYFPLLLYNRWYKGLNEGGENMEDKRVFSRFAAKLTVKFLDLARNKEGLAQTHDISAKGLGLVTSEQLAEHTPLELWVVVPDKGEPLYTRGEIIWSEQIGAHKFKAGINLEKADLMGMSRVLRAI